MEYTKYQVIDILRLPAETITNGTSFYFYLVLFNIEYEIREVHPDQVNDIIKGLVYKNDFVYYENEKFVVTDGNINLRTLTHVDINFLEDLQIHYLPFLTDTPLIPCQTIPSGTMTILENQTVMITTESSTFKSTTKINPLKRGSLVSKVLLKSRILTCKAKCPYFFYVVLTDGTDFLKLFFWRENVRYFQNIFPGDTIAVNTYSKNSKKSGDPRINSYQENFLIECNSIQLGNNHELYKIAPRQLKDSVSITQTHYYRKSVDFYFDLSGQIIFISVLLRKRSSLESFIEHKDRIIEYFLIQIQTSGKTYNVVLFNNSQKEFEKLKTRDNVQISNLWKIRRGEYEYYTNSLYTQIQIYEKLPMTTNRDSSATNSAETENEFRHSKTQIHENALCYMPDEYNDLADVRSNSKNFVYNLDYDVKDYFYIYETNIKDILVFSEHLVISEHKKFIFTGYLSDIALDFMDETFYEQSAILFDYYTEEGEKQLPTGSITITDENYTLDILVFRNLFAKEENVFTKFNIKDEIDLKPMLGKKLSVIIDACRVSRDDVILSLSKAYLINE